MPISDYYEPITPYTKTGTANGRGGSKLTWTPGAAFMGLINQASSVEVEAAAKLGVEADYKLYCPVTVAITTSNLVGLGSQIFRVVSKPKNTVHRNHHYKVLLKETSLDLEAGHGL